MVEVSYTNSAGEKKTWDVPEYLENTYHLLAYMVETKSALQDVLQTAVDDPAQDMFLAGLLKVGDAPPVDSILMSAAMLGTAIDELTDAMVESKVTPPDWRLDDGTHG